jgi:hypothetical protein
MYNIYLRPPADPPLHPPPDTKLEFGRFIGVAHVGHMSLIVHLTGQGVMLSAFGRRPLADGAGKGKRDRGVSHLPSCPDNVERRTSSPPVSAGSSNGVVSDM